MTEPAEQFLHRQLTSEACPETAMLYTEAHGYLCAMAIRPDAFDPSSALAEIMGADTTDVPTQNAIQALHASIQHQLSQGEPPELPCDEEDEPGEPPLQGWAIGFMEAFLEDPDVWTGPPEDLVSELTLPILSVSGLLDEDELQDIADHPDLVMSMCEQIPDILIDLFLLYHAPE